jgi:serine/threonine protein kinase
MVAIKELFPQGLCMRDRTGTVRATAQASEQDMDTLADMFLREAEIICSIRHPNIVEGLQGLAENGTGYLVMRYVSGKNLYEHLRTRQGGLAVTPESVARVFLPLMDALAALHDKGVLHCDIKPDNIFLGVDYHPILIDLGAARLRDPSFGWEQSATFFPHFAAIEQYDARFGKPGPWTDIYQLSAVAYRCIAKGKIPDSLERAEVGEDPYFPLIQMPDLRRTYPRPILEMFDRGLALYPSQRPSSVDEWVEDALPVLGKLIGSPSARTASPPPLPPRRKVDGKQKNHGRITHPTPVPDPVPEIPSGKPAGTDPLSVLGKILATAILLILGSLLMRGCG